MIGRIVFFCVDVQLESSEQVGRKLNLPEAGRRKLQAVAQRLYVDIN